MQNKFYRWFLIYIFSGTFLGLYAQNSDTPKQLSNTYFLKNCFVVKQPGVTLSGQNVVIKDGLIAEIGPNILPPFDAQMIKSDSFYVYAGFIDGYSNTGIVKPENKERAKISDPGNPPNDLAGITPQLKAIDQFKSSEKSVSDMRSAGICLSNVVPRGLMLPGSSDLILLSDGPQDKMLLKAGTGQSFQLEPMRGGFPSTTIGVISKFRDLYKNANIVGSHDEKFKLNAAGLSRPDYSKELVALYPVTTKKQSLFFKAQKTKDVHKALSLKNELGFEMILADVKQGWHYIDQIKKTNSKVFISIELPEDDKKDIKKDSLKDVKNDSLKTTPKKAESLSDKNPEKDSFDQVREKSLKEYVSQAATFEKAGIAFGFSFLDAKTADVKKNIKKMIDNGLSENAALAALTTNPAQILGVSHLVGTVEKGKIANLVITNKSYFEEKSTISYVFVDGKKYDFTEKPKKDNKPSEAGKFTGKWSYVVEIPGSTQKGKVNVKKVDGNYKISIVDDSTPNEEDTAEDIKLEGNNLTFYIMADMGQPVKVDFDLKMEDQSYSGSVSIAQFGTFPIKGEYEGQPD
jgi:Amidohydrolase family